MATWKYEKDAVIDFGFYAGDVPVKVRFEYNTTSDSGYFIIENKEYKETYGGFGPEVLKAILEILKEFDKGYGLRE